MKIEYRGGSPNHFVSGEEEITLETRLWYTKKLVTELMLRGKLEGQIDPASLIALHDSMNALAIMEALQELKKEVAQFKNWFAEFSKTVNRG